MSDGTAPARSAHAWLVDYLDLLRSDPAALRGQMLRGGGPVLAFEKELSRRCGFPHVLCMSNATTALLVTAHALDLPAGSIAHDDRAWVGSVSCLRFAGARTVAVSTLPPDEPKNLTAVLASDSPQNRHDAAALRKFCDRAGVIYIEDTDRLPGVTVPETDYSLADVQVLSFGPGKAISIGEGGALLCRDPSVYQRAVAWSQHPERCIHEGIPVAQDAPINGRMNPLGALLGLLRLEECHPEGSLARVDDRGSISS